MFLLTKPANKHKQMLTRSSFLLFPAIYLFKCCLVASRAEPSPFPSECLINVRTERTSTHPPPNFPHRRRTLNTKKKSPSKVIIDECANSSKITVGILEDL